MSDNPFRNALVMRSQPESCTVVIFGATGDLTHRKLIPALYNLQVDGALPSGVRIVGFARREKSDEAFRAGLEKINKEVSRNGHDDVIWKEFASRIFYHQSTFEDYEGYRALLQRIEEWEGKNGGNRLLYIASSPNYFKSIFQALKASGLNKAPSQHWSRVIIEKPFGVDLPSAQDLNLELRNAFHEKDTFRIDHYLGKETAQNIMVLRFANAIFEPLWNNRFIEQIQITCAEDLGMEGGRGGYYDTAGALRDMVQNHLLQLLSLIAMEPPTDLSANGIRDEKVKVLRALRQWDTAQKVRENVVRAQYEEGYISGKKVVGYRQEDRVATDSKTESYVALRVFVDSWRWSGVPFYVRMGKRLAKKATEISVHFRQPPSVLFNALPEGVCGGNVLVIRIQPDEGISLRMVSKIPGAQLRLEPVKMDFRYATSFGKGSPEAYERLLLDCMAGDATLFARRDEVQEAWRFIDHIQRAWKDAQAAIPMERYVAGTWGPEVADTLLEENEHQWRRL